MISNYWHFECEKSSSRYLSIANMAADAGIDVEVLTSSFYHALKKQREISEGEFSKYKYKVTLIKEPGYKKNIDLRRIISHKKFAKNVKLYLRNRKKPDAIYLFVPPLGLAEIVANYARKNNIRLIIDILDLWPEAYNMIMPLPRISRFLLIPMTIKANKIYASADEIIAVSETYVNRALKYNNKCTKGLPVYIGAELSAFSHPSPENKIDKKNNEVWIAYIGTLGTSYNLYCIINAIKKLKDNTNVTFIVMGSGPKRIEFEKYAQQSGIKYIFTGQLPYNEMVARLCQCDIAVNPIKSTSAATIINKVADYAAAGLPVINTQNSIEYKELLMKYNAGFSFNETDIAGIADGIDRLIHDKSLRQEMGKNSRKLFEEKFDRNKSYSAIIEKIKGLIVK